MYVNNVNSMSVISSKLYKALKAAHVEDNQAVEAAEKVGNFEVRMSKIDTKLNILIGLCTAMFCSTIAILFTVVLLFAK